MTNRKRIIVSAAIAVFIAGGIFATLYTAADVTPYDYKVYKVENGWGYDISHNGRTVIHQPFIPAAEGINPFPNKASAREAAVALVEKLSSDQMQFLTDQN